MPNLSGWDIAIMVAATYISIVTLVRLMRRRRDEVVAQLHMQIETAKQRKRAEERDEKRRQTRSQHTHRSRTEKSPEREAA